MIDLKRYEQLKQEVGRVQRDKDRAEGALSQLMARLKSEFSCDTLDQAKRSLAKMNKERDRTEKTLEDSMAEFEEKWGDQLEGEDT